MSMSTTELLIYQDRLIEEFTPFWALNDPAHRIDHFKDVQVCGMRINRELGLGYPLKTITLVAYIHDLFTWSRINHHELSALWVETTDHWSLANYTDDERWFIAEACLQHRASYKGEYTSGLSELMASADRGMPKPVLAIVERSIQYTMAQGHTLEQARPLAIAHIKDKYASTGYARYPDMYYKVFGTELDAQRKAVENLTIDNLHELLD